MTLALITMKLRHLGANEIRRLRERRHRYSYKTHIRAHRDLLLAEQTTIYILKPLPLIEQKISSIVFSRPIGEIFPLDHFRAFLDEVVSPLINIKQRKFIHHGHRNDTLPGGGAKL